MISWFLSKNKIRTTTCDEFIDVIFNNKDLLYKEGTTNIGGIHLYHFKDDGDEVHLSYGSLFIVFEPLSRHVGKYFIRMGSNGKTDLLECTLQKDNVCFSTKNGGNEEVPFSAFESDTDFFQYTLLNLKYECSDSSLIKLIKFITEFLNEQSK